MRRRTVLITAAAVAVAAIVAGLAVWLSQPSYNDIVDGCAKALKEQYKKGGKGKPDACKDVKADDYETLDIAAILRDSGWVDDDGNADMNKILDDATQQP
ncbi:hypothetical protein ACIQCF_04560 [Streptomyces sp. NPDC088353]|uniref:hypothetical protein n=1 Tax=unclassified Streptomyces TaxID=2593676 RepID=UPI00369C74EA